jgi:hypothetical protein
MKIILALLISIFSLFVLLAILNYLATHQYALQTNGKVYRIYDRYRGVPVLIYGWEERRRALDALSGWNAPLLPFRVKRVSPWTSGEWMDVSEDKQSHKIRDGEAIYYNNYYSDLKLSPEEPAPPTTKQNEKE